MLLVVPNAMDCHVTQTFLIQGSENITVPECCFLGLFYKPERHMRYIFLKSQCAQCQIKEHNTPQIQLYLLIGTLMCTATKNSMV
jgi:hypothetical protein